jgi:adenylate cyclase
MNGCARWDHECGVNIAARLKSLADPGRICVPKTAFDQIETKLPFVYEYLGEQSVKNITNRKRLFDAWRGAGLK